MASKRALYSELLVTLPTFAAMILQRRARDRRQTVSEVIETLLLENCSMDEAQAVALETPAGEQALSEWLSDVFVKRKRK